MGVKHKGPGRFADLDAWEPASKYAQEEQVGLKAWSGPAPAPIGSNARLAPAPLEQIFGDLLKHLWVAAEAPTGPRAGNFLAQTRQAQPGLPQAAPYRPMVAPTVINPHAPVPGQRPLPAYPNVPAHARPAAPRLPPPPPPRPAPPPPPNAHLQGVARDWDLHKGLQRFSGYAFRGDHRDPSTIRTAGGFLPSSTRSDDGFIKGAVYDQFCNYMQRRFQKNLKAAMLPEKFLEVVRQSARTPADREAFRFYTAWRALAAAEELHLGRMVAQETLKAYISTTRAVPVAKGFAKRGTTEKGERPLGWVYCVAVNGGFVVPDKQATYWTETFGEAEIAIPGIVPWADVVAARAVDYSGKFAGDLHVRKGFNARDPNAFETIGKLMSGKKQ